VIGARGGLAIAGRAFLQVVLVSAQTVTLAAYQQHGEPWRLAVAGAVAFSISWVWWANARAATLSSVPAGRWWYAGGAAAGTLAGAASMGWLMR